MSIQQTLDMTLPMVAAALASSYGIKVVIGKTQGASTDGNTIYLPPLPADNEKAYAIAHGYLDHETAHIKFTDFEAYSRTASVSYMHEAICNILEDVRIEQKMSRFFPGCAINLKRLTHILVKDGVLESVQQQDNEAVILQKFILYYLRRHVLQQTALDTLAQESTERLKETLPKGAFTRLLSLLSGADKLGSTKDCAEMTNDILAMLKEEKEKEQNKPKQEQPSAQSGQATESGTGGQGGNSASQAADGGQDVGKPQPGDAGQSDCKNATAEPAEAASNGEQPATGNAGDAIERILNSQSQDTPFNADMGKMLEGMLDDVQAADSACITVGEAGTGGVSLSSGDGNALFNKALRYSSALRPRLIGLLQSHRKRHSRPANKGRRIALKRIHRIVTNDPKVFLRKAPVSEVNTAISILLDASGSMRRVMDTANLSVMSVAHAMDLIDGVATGVAVYPGRAGSDVDIITRIGEPVSANRNRFNMAAGGGTPMAAAMWRAATDLMLAPQPRKILLVITDGEARAMDIKSIDTLIAAAAASGMEIMALGIGNLQIASHFPTHQTITSINELSNAMFNMLKDKLLNVA